MCFLMNLLFDSCYDFDDNDDDYINEGSDTMTSDDKCDDENDIYMIYEHIDCGIDLLG